MKCYFSSLLQISFCTIILLSEFVIFSGFPVQLWMLHEYCLVRKNILHTILIQWSFVVAPFPSCIAVTLPSKFLTMHISLPDWFSQASTKGCYSLQPRTVCSEGVVMGKVGPWHASARASRNHLFYHPFIYLYPDQSLRVLMLLLVLKSEFAWGE